MKAGYARLEITPGLGDIISGAHVPRISTGILDPLYATAVVFGDGEKTVAAITLDILELTFSSTDKIRTLVAERTGLDRDAILVHSIHTHLGPEVSGVMYKPNEGYVDYLFKRIADAVTFAIADMKEAKAYIATGEAKGISFIRRFIMKDGSGKTNPPIDDPDILCPEGEPDENVQLVKIVREGGHDIAIVNFQTHPDCIGGTQISADFIHFVRLTLEQALVDEADGKGCKVAYFNGAQGDTNCRNIHDYKRGYTHVRHMGRVIAAGVLSVYTYAKEVNTDKVFFKVVDVDVPVDTRYAEKCAIRLTCIGAGDIGFMGFSGEPYTEIGRQLKAGSAFAMTIPTCNTNGWLSYLPMKESFERGGMGVDGCDYLPGGAEIAIEAAIELTKELKGN